MQNNKISSYFLLFLGLITFIYIVIIIIDKKSEIVDPVNIRKVLKIYNVSISSDFDYYIGDTSLYKGKEIIFYRFDDKSIITIIKNGHKNDTGIKNNTVYNISLNELIKPLDVEKMNCNNIDFIPDKLIQGFNISVLIKNKKIKYTFTKDNIYIKELTNTYNSILKTKDVKKRMYQCNFDIYIHNNFISKIKNLPKLEVKKKEN